MVESMVESSSGCRSRKKREQRTDRDHPSASLRVADVTCQPDFPRLTRPSRFRRPRIPFPSAKSSGILGAKVNLRVCDLSGRCGTRVRDPQRLSDWRSSTLLSLSRRDELGACNVSHTRRPGSELTTSCPSSDINVIAVRRRTSGEIDGRISAASHLPSIFVSRARARARGNFLLRWLAPLVYVNQPEYCIRAESSVARAIGWQPPRRDRIFRKKNVFLCKNVMSFKGTED
jgi:hypothetical protein